MGNNPILEVQNLGKKYPKFELKDVSFSLYPGKIMGFIGRNGAGKTTTLKLIYGLIKKDAGEVFYDGHPIENEEAFKCDIGMLFGGIDFYPNQKAKTIADVTKRFYPSWDEELFQKWVRYFEVDLSKKVKELSNGMRVKFNLAIALSHGAKVLLLDEPTSGLDPVSRDELLDAFRRIAKEKGTAILFSTHVISDLDKIADDIAYIQKGSIVAFESVPDFKKRYRHVEGKTASLSGSEQVRIQHFREKDGRYAGVVLDDDPVIEGATYQEASLEEIMLAIERGNDNEESPF